MQLEKFWDQKPEYHLEWPNFSFRLLLAEVNLVVYITSNFFAQKQISTLSTVFLTVGPNSLLSNTHNANYILPMVVYTDGSR